MKKVVIYEALDGTEFRTEKECLEYDLLHSTMGYIKRTCELHGVDCTGCPFYSEEESACGAMRLIHAEPNSGVLSPNFWEI